ncbi:MAG: HD domain-containing protein [Clostridia bacterium]
MEHKQEFIEIYNANIKREGADKLLEYLLSSDFFTAPASTRFHLAEEGGLVEHSLNVYKRLKKLVEWEYGENFEEHISAESIAICGLLHDLCKVDFYRIDYRNVKTPEGVWEKRPYYTIEEKLPYGHGEKSVYIINGFLRLTREEALAINWHMGGFDDRVRAGSYAIAGAYTMYPLCVFLSTADLMASYLDESRVS